MATRGLGAKETADTLAFPGGWPSTCRSSWFCARRSNSLAVAHEQAHVDPGMPGATPHIYGKAERPGRKLGHVTLTGSKNGFDAGFGHRLARLLRIAGEEALAAEMENPAAA